MRSLFVVVTLFALGCSPGAPASHEATSAVPASPNAVPAMPVAKAGVTVDTPKGPVHFAVELAVKDADRQRGLMFREHLDDDAGMLFIFEQQKPLAFWMKNTHIPLDMIFIDEGGTIAGVVEDAEPMTLSSRKVDAPSRYVLEVNAGTANKLGIAAGQRVHFDTIQPSLVDPRTLR